MVQFESGSVNFHLQTFRVTSAMEASVVETTFGAWRKSWDCRLDFLEIIRSFASIYKPFMTATLALIAFVSGAILCVTNFYLSFLRYPLHRLRGLPRESYHWDSGIPV